ncbi:hypothetical protein [Lentzea sp. CC55]|uniref:hypothetical protein n=1 Tax=Lentzea sp. CC55 TaxID=2884909 RepID=UPI001F4052FC|nr:hypothetical protein [Lentzea sp. CC55]MCG8920925.1 hypothetical protein [Lentzea sp. CC55]
MAMVSESLSNELDQGDASERFHPFTARPGDHLGNHGAGPDRTDRDWTVFDGLGAVAELDAGAGTLTAGPAVC